MGAATLTCGLPNPGSPLMEQVLCFPGVDAPGVVTGIRGKVVLRRAYPGTERLRVLVTDRCTPPVGWAVTEGGCVYSTDGTVVDTDLPSVFYGYGNILLDVRIQVSIDATGEYAAELEPNLSEADRLVTDLKRWSGPLYLTLLRENDSEYSLLHTAKDNRSTLTVTWEDPAWHKESFLQGLLAGLVSS